jgi:hypothetical protein
METRCAYYFQYTNNDAEIFLQLPGSDNWVCWALQYTTDTFKEVRESKATELSVSDLPDLLLLDYDLRYNSGSIKAIYRLLPA